jgi:phage tail sheath protein FI
MPEYLSPGVYIEELAGPKPIEGVGTSTGAFVGIAEKGPVNSPQLITNLTQFNDTFGGFLPNAFLAYAVQHFFTEGGTRCYVTRAFKFTPPPPPVPPALVSVVDPKVDVARADLHVGAPPTPPTPPTAVVMTVFATSAGRWGNDIAVQVLPAGFPAVTSDKKFRLDVFYKGVAVESFDQLSMAEFDSTGLFANPDHVERRINGISKFITVMDASTVPTNIDPPFIPAPAVPPAAPVPIPITVLGSGSDGAAVVPNDLIGAVASGTAVASGLFAFDAVDDINIVAIPDLVLPAFTAADVRAAIGAGMTYCENRKDCFYVADTLSGLSPQTALAFKRGVAPFSGNAFASKYGAIYYPWIVATDSLTGKGKLLPPSGAVAGSYSASDVRVGVHKAPAGIDDGFLNSAIDIERVITKGEQDTLNPEGVNVIRKFADAGIVIWGARTVSSDPEWKYVNVRRLFIFLEESILKGTQGVVFEPNDPSLWKRIIRDVGAFLRIQWSEGKLVGDKPDKAFFVKCDAETNPPESVDLGRVITMIGVAPSKPAEFVIFRIRQTRSGGGVSE